MSRRPARRRVLVFGTFDLFHPGHLSFLRQARRLGHELIVGIGRDQIVKQLKGRRPAQHETHRQAIVAAVTIVDQAIIAPRDPRRRWQFIRRLKPHVIALGYDQTHYTETLAEELRQRRLNIDIVRLRPFLPKKYKTSFFRKSGTPHDVYFRLARSIKTHRR